MLKPKLISVLQNDYKKEQLFKDITAGIIVGIMAIPLSVALAAVSGVSPEKVLYTAIIAGFIVSLLGGSMVQISGPTGTMVVIAYDIIAKHGYHALIISTILAGLILIFLGLLKKGNLLKLIPYPITTGFAIGKAIILFTHQLKDFFGFNMAEVPPEFIPRISNYIKSLNTVSLNSLIIGIIALLIIKSWPLINKRIPGTLMALIISTALAHLLKFDVETLGDRYSQLSSKLAFAQLTEINPFIVAELFPVAITIAVFAGAESLLSAVVAEGMTGDRHNSNMELASQGVANILAGLIGGIPVSGSISNTAANIKNGGRTPVAGMVHSLTIFTALLLLMPIIKLIPVSALSAILIVVACNMVEWVTFKNLLKAPKTDIIVLLLTLILTIVFDLVIAIAMGIIMAYCLFLKRRIGIPKESSDKNNIVADMSDFVLDTKTGIDPSIQIFQIYESFFFGAADNFTNITKQNIAPTHSIILNMKSVSFIDATDYHALFKIYSYCRRHKILLLFIHVQMQPLAVMEKNGFIELISRDNFCCSMDAALERANAYIELIKYTKKGKVRL